MTDTFQIKDQRDFTRRMYDSAGVDSVIAAAIDSAPPLGMVVSQVLVDGTDQKTLLDAEIAALMAAGGGTLVLPVGTIRYDGTITLPNDGATPPKQPPLLLQGQGSHWSGRGTAIVGGTVLDIRGTATYGKILTTGLGLLALRDLTLRDTAGTTTPFVYTTNTTLMADHVGFFGSKVTSACDQDAFILGGTVQIEGQGDPTHGFQGYGTVIKDCFFSGIRRTVVGQVFCNAVVIRNNTVWSTCGHTTGAAIEVDGGTPQVVAGMVIAENLIELPNYRYGVKMANAQRCSLVHNNMYDSTGTTTAAVRFESTAQYNMLIDGYLPGALTAVSDASTDANGNPTNTHLTPAQSVMQTFASPAQFLSDVASLFRVMTATGGDSKFTVQPAAIMSDTGRLIQAKRSAAESSNPSADVFYLQQNGTILVRGSNAGNFSFQDAAGASVLTLTGNGKTWTYPGGGGQVTIDSGTNGSYIILKLFGLKLTKQDSSYTITLIPVNATPEASSSQPVGSIAANTAGTAATGVMYVKESGAGNTGWSAVQTRTGIYVKEGSNARQGVATMVAGTVTVANTAVTANSRILLTTQSLGTILRPAAVGVTASVAGTSFTITSSDITDTSVVAYQICEPG